jgi:hypothetical protein
MKIIGDILGKHLFDFILAWPDQSCPDIAQPLIELVKNVQQSRFELSNTNKSVGPIVVHCRYGPPLF